MTVITPMALPRMIKPDRILLVHRVSNRHLFGLALVTHRQGTVLHSAGSVVRMRARDSR